MEIRLIAMDLDGTSLLPDHCSFSPRLLSALERAHKKGILIVPATGRPFGILPPPLTQHPTWESYIIVSNGGQIRNLKTADTLDRVPFSRETLQSLLSLSEELDLPIELSAGDRLYLTKDSFERKRFDPTLAFHVNTVLPKYGVIVPSFDEICNSAELQIEKASFSSIPEQIRDTLEQRVKSLPVSAVWASQSMFEITHIDATKGNALKTLCRMLDIPLSATMALGDSGNDVSMLKAAGLGVAMQTAPSYVQAAADAITESNTQDGAALAIVRYALAENPT